MAHPSTRPDPDRPAEPERVGTKAVANPPAGVQRTKLAARLVAKAKDADAGKTVSLAGLSDDDLIASLRRI